MAASKEFLWTDDELDLLLRCAVVYKSKCEHEGLSWEGTRAKYKEIKELIVERYPDKPTDNPNEQFPRIGKTELLTKERVSAKLKKMRTDYKKAVDNGRKSGGGRVVFTFYNLCESLRGGSPAVESIDTGIDSGYVQNESTESVTDEMSPETDGEDDSETSAEVAVNQEECESAKATKKRRAEVAEMLNARKDKKINQKLTTEAQFLNCAKEDLDLKRKLIDRLDKEDSDFKESMSKLNKTMETVGESINQSMMLLAQFLRPPGHMPTASMESQYMPHHVAYNHQQFHGVAGSTTAYPVGESHSGMAMFQHSLNNGARAHSEADCDYY